MPCGNIPAAAAGAPSSVLVGRSSSCRVLLVLLFWGVFFLGFSSRWLLPILFAQLTVCFNCERGMAGLPTFLHTLNLMRTTARERESGRVGESAIKRIGFVQFGVAKGVESLRD